MMARPRFTFYTGVVVGFAVCLLLSTLSTLSHSSSSSTRQQGSLSPSYGAAHAKESSATFLLQRRSPSDLSADDLHAHAHETLDAAVGGENAKEVKFEDLHAHHDDDSQAKELAGRVRVLVWVMTSPDNLDKKAVHVRNTWGKRANTLLFMSSKWNSTFPTIGLNVSEGREHLTAKTMQAFRYVYEHYFDDADWFMKADDDTYVIVENLRYLLSTYNPQDPIYFGHAFKVIVKQGYASGGAGYVISKEALRRLVTEGTQTTGVCRKDGGAEDVELGKCLMNLGVKLMPSVDRLGRSRFHCFGPETHLQGGYPKWYLQYDANGAKIGIENISDYPVSFHYIPPSKMYAMEFFVYHLRPFGIVSRTQSLNLPQNAIATR